MAKPCELDAFVALNSREPLSKEYSVYAILLGGSRFFQAVREGGGVTDSFISVHSWSLYHFRSQISADLLTASIFRQTAHTYFLLVIEKWVQMKYNVFE